MLKDQNQKKFAIHTLGCKVNTYESDAISEALRKAGFLEVSFADPADVYIINTCTVTNVADKKSRQMLHRAKKLNPEALIVAAGCYVDAAMQNESMQAVLRDSAIDLLVPNRDKGRITELILEKLFPEKEGAETDPERHPEEAAPEAGHLFVTELDGHTRAFIKVQDGCNQFCSYCIIPYVRGRIKSRPLEDCVAEIRGLADKGIREVVLTGIHLSSYGKDFRREESSRDGETRVASDDIENGGKAPLLDLIRAVHGISGIRRIRLGSLEPRLMDEDFVRELAKLPKVCPHFHLSLQSGCRETLKRMNRHYTPEEYLESCRRIRQYYPHPAITTDVIVGFPGETEEEFAESREFLRKVRFYEMHVFKYSRRAGTRADRMEGQVPEAVKEARSRELIALAEEMSHSFRRDYLGKETEFLCEEEICLQGERYALGYNREYVKCVKKIETFHQNEIVSGTGTEICKEKAVYESLILR